jgi:DNA-binding XRE family transcriptional regulator
MRDVDPEAFANRVKARLDKTGMSQSAAAKEIGIRQQTMQNVCAGKVKNPRFINELAETLTTTRVWLLYGDPPEVVIPENLRERAETTLSAVADTRLIEAISALERLAGPPSPKNASKGKSGRKSRAA